MKKLFLIALVVIFVLVLAIPTFAHVTGPCADSDGDGSASGVEYATHHISAMAQEGLLGDDGHVPGTHHGFSACDPAQNP
jgi:hypothetical protein